MAVFSAIAGGVGAALAGGDDGGAAEMRRAQIDPDQFRHKIAGSVLSPVENQRVDQFNAEIQALRDQPEPANGFASFGRAMKIKNLIDQRNKIIHGTDQSLARRLSAPSLMGQQNIDRVDDAINPNMLKLLQSPELRRLRELGQGDGTTTAELAGFAQQNQIGRNIAARAAQGNALRNPAVAMAALREQSRLGQNAAAGIAANASNERLGALNSSLINRANIRGTDFAQRAQEQGILQNLRAQEIGNQQLGYNAEMGIAGLNAGISQNAAQAQSQADQRFNGALQGAISGAGALFNPLTSPQVMGMFGGGGGGGNPIASAGVSQALGGGGAGILGSAGSGLAPLAALSDVRAKERITEKGDALKSFLNGIKAYEYTYKKGPQRKGLAQPGRHASVMAQDLEKAGPIGKRMIIETAHGKMVDYGKGLPAMLAGLADANQRLKRLEKKGRKG